MSIKDFKPFVSDSTKMPELTLVPILMGIVLGIIFGASSLYLALKVGLTVSASIPVAVLSITLFRAFSKAFGMRKSTILENNIVQTTGSAGESIAFGVAVTMPALLILGYDMNLERIMTVAILGGILGVLMMIPLRNALIVKEHGKLIYPEGTACAEILIVGEKGGTSAATVFSGFFIGLIYKFLNVANHLWIDVPEKALNFFKGATVAAEVSPELLGVGYIIGTRTACIMAAGGFLSALVLTPAIALFGGGLTTPLFPATKLISQMDPHEIWKNYVLYIGAGAVAAGGIVSLAQSLPTIIKGALAGLGDLKASREIGHTNKRTDHDMSMKVVLLGSLALILAIWCIPSLKMNLIGAVLIVLFGFLFVTVSSRLTGQIGSSSNPISGMTVATLLLTSLVFLVLGWTSPDFRVTALSVAAIVCVAASNGGTTSQDLKTGHLVGATPRSQQIALLIGVVTSALVIGFTLNLLNNASTVYSRKDLPTNHIPNVSSMKEMMAPQGIKDDHHEYHMLRVTELAYSGPLAGLSTGRYLVDDNGRIRYLIDPGINGVLRKRDDGASVQKYDAPKARLMSLIIDGILTRKLPWGLVLLGVAISLVLELCAVSSLAFAVGVYLPLSASTPILAGGLVRWLAEFFSKKKSSTESESSPGVLMSSGLIAGGSVAGIGIALTSLYEGVGDKLDLSAWFPRFANSNLVSIVIFAALCALLFKVAKKAD